MSTRKMVRVQVIHDGGFTEEISTDDPLLLGQWLIYTAHKMPQHELGLRGNWHVTAWETEA